MTPSNRAATGGMVTITEARRRFGVSPNVLRRAIRTREIPSVWDTSVYPPRYRVRPEDAKRVSGAWRPWHDHDDDALIVLLGKMPREEIARRLNRSVSSINHRMKRLAVNSRVGESHYTGSQAALALGVTREGILTWIRAGEIKTLKYRPVWGRTRCHIIKHEEIERFIRARITGAPRKKPCWTWRKIPPGYFRNYAEQVAARMGGATA